MGTATSALLASRVLIFLGVLGPLFPIIGSGILHQWGCLALFILILILLPMIPFVPGDEPKNRGIMTGVLLAIYVLLWIYLCIHCMKDFTVVANRIVSRGFFQSRPLSSGSISPSLTPIAAP
jgi:hypothetical protein